MIKLRHLKNFLKKITPLLTLFIILIFSHLPLAIIDDLFTRSYHSYNIHSKSNFVVPSVLIIVCIHNGQKSIQHDSTLI